MARVYLETSFVSACVTDRTDAASVYRRAASLEWMHAQSSRHELAISAEVVAEISHPSFARREAAKALVKRMPLLDITDEVLGIAALLVRERVMPSPVSGDAIHIAVACVHDMDYLLSWNVRHLANPNKLVHLRTICRRVGVVPPTIVTPDLLWDDES